MITIVLILAVLVSICYLKTKSFKCHCSYNNSFVYFDILYTMKNTNFVISVLYLIILHSFGILIGVKYSKASTIHKREVIKHVRFKPTRSGNIRNYISLIFTWLIINSAFELRAWICVFSLFTGCSGSVYLYSTDNEKEVRVDSGKFQNIMKSRRRKSVTKKVATPGVRFAKLEGSCCWELREKVYGGHKKQIMNPNIYHLPWDIRFIKLTKC